MKSIAWICLILAVVAVANFPSLQAGKREAPGFHESASFDELFMRYMKERRVPGATVAVARKGRFLVKKGFGRASQHRLMTPWTLVRTGEISKVLTSAGVLKLHEMGKLSLDQPAFGERGVLKEYGQSEMKDPRTRDITVRHLLQHTSGWDHESTGDSLLRPGRLRNFVDEKLRHRHQSVYYEPGRGPKAAASNPDQDGCLPVFNRYASFSESYNELFGVGSNRSGPGPGHKRTTSVFSPPSSAVSSSSASSSSYSSSSSSSFSSSRWYKREGTGHRRRQRTNGRQQQQHQHQEVNRHTVVRYFLKQPLQHEPGQRFSYLNFGYMVLGLIIERTSQRSYESFIRELLLKVGIYRMKVSRTQQARDGDISEVEYFSTNGDGTISSTMDVERSSHAPEVADLLDACSGWLASASDLVTFFESLHLLFPGKNSNSRQVLLANGSFQSMTERPGYSLGAERTSWYGLGLVVEDSGRSFWHGGSLDGSTGVLYRDDQEYAWAALLNCKLQPNDLSDFMSYAVRLAFGKSHQQPSAQFLLSQQQQHHHSRHLHHLGHHHHHHHPNHNQQQQQAPVQHTTSYASHVLATNDIDEFQEAEPKFRSQEFSTRAVGRQSNDAKVMVPDYKLHELLEFLSDQLRRPTWFDAYESPGGQVFFNVIWTKNDDPYSRWRMYFDLIPSRYRRRYNARVAQGYRLSHVETYVSKKRLRYAALFVKDDWSDWTAYEGYSPARHKAEFYRMLENGYRLVVQSVAEFKGRLYVAAIYDKFFVGDGRVRLGLTLEQLSDELNRQLANGQILSYVQAYTNRERLKFSAIWSPRMTKHWVVSPAMTKYTLLNRLHQHSSSSSTTTPVAATADVQIACLSSYHADGVTYFVALWR